jgi:hypothetical protein
VELPSTTSYSSSERHYVGAAINRGGPMLSIRSGDRAINVSGLRAFGEAGGSRPPRMPV